MFVLFLTSSTSEGKEDADFVVMFHATDSKSCANGLCILSQISLVTEMELAGVGLKSPTRTETLYKNKLMLVCDYKQRTGEVSLDERRVSTGN